MNPMMHSSWRIVTVTFLVAFLLFLGNLSAASDTTDYFRITVVDEATGRGVPLVISWIVLPNLRERPVNIENMTLPKNAY
jgi:hypothetical protein